MVPAQTPRTPQIQVAFVDNVFGVLDDPRRLSLNWEGQTVAEIFAAHCPDQLRRAPVAASINGRKLEREDWARPLGRDVQVVFTPDPGGDPVTLLIYLAVSIAINLIYAALTAQPDQRTPQVRDEQRSATYAYDQTASEYRANQPIPFAFGLCDLGGQVIYTSIFASSGAANTAGPTEQLSVILSLCEGPIQAIGGAGRELTEDTDNLGGFERQIDPPGARLPSDIRINGNRIDWDRTPIFQGPPNSWWTNLPGIEAAVRLGSIDQQPMPRFPGSASVQVVNQQLERDGEAAVTTINDTNRLTSVAVIIGFPGGLYQQDQTGSFGVAPTLSFTVEFRRVGTSTWIGLGTFQPTLPLPGYTINTFAVTGRQLFSTPTTGPIEVRVTRNGPNADPSAQVVTSATFRQIQWFVDADLAYPGVSLLGLRIEATEATTGGRNGYLVRGKWGKVRVWDSTINSGQPSGTADREGDHWEVPAAGNAYHGIWSYPPGQNPAWIFATLCTHPRGLGRKIADSQIDWPAIRDWADFCDQDVDYNGQAEAAFQAAIVFDDASTSALDALRRICRAGRARPIIKGNKLSVVYQYRDAHGRGTNSVPAKVATQVFSTSNCTEFQVRYFNPRDRPTVLFLQYLAESLDYAQDAPPVVDPEAEVADPGELNPWDFTKEAHQLYGVTRYSQLRREGLFMHAANRLVTSEVSLRVPLSALACEVGDLIRVQHDAFSPFDSDAFARRFTQASGTGTEFTVRGPVTLPSSAFAIFRDANGDVQEVALVSTAGAYADGATLELATAHDLVQGTPVILGVQSKVAATYEVQAISLEADLSRQIVALKWVPEIHDLDDVYEDDPSGSASFPSGGDEDLVVDNLGLQPTDLTLDATTTRGRYRFGWIPPDGYAGLRCHVFARLPSASRWIPAAQTTGQSVEIELVPGASYELTVVVESRRAEVPSPEIGAVLEVTAPEFAAVRAPGPESVTARFLPGEGAVLLRTQDVDAPEFDRFEWRKGSSWLAGERIGETTDPWLRTEHLAGAGEEDRSTTFHVAARMRSGMLSNEVSVVFAEPSLGTALHEEEMSTTTSTVDSLVPGGSTDVEWVIDPSLSLGTVTSAAIDLGFDAVGRILIAWFVEEAKETLEASAATFAVRSGEAMFRRILGRDPSPLDPGTNPDLTIDDALAMSFDDARARGLLVSGAPRGVVCSNFTVRAWVRTALEGETLSAQPWRVYTGAEPVAARYLQWRIQMHRRGSSADRTLKIRQPILRFVV